MKAVMHERFEYVLFRVLELIEGHFFFVFYISLHYFYLFKERNIFFFTFYIVKKENLIKNKKII